MSAQRRVRADTLLRDCPDHGVGLALSEPISRRIDLLVGLAEQAGERTSRKELIACLIYASPARGQDVAEMLRSYRHATVEDALPDSDMRQNIHVSKRQPGPRPRRKL
jgi:hypothetical protein